MKILKCDQCGSDGKDVKTYTYTKKFMSVKAELPEHYLYSGGTYVNVPEVKEFCDNCATNIHASYKHFLEEYVP